MGSRPKPQQIAALPPPEDISGKAARAAASRATTSALTSSGRRGSFLTGGAGGEAAPIPAVARAASADAIPWDAGLEEKFGGGPGVRGAIGRAVGRSIAGRHLATQARARGSY